MVGRNDPCPCGSGKKYKKCCMRKDQEAARAQDLAEPPQDTTAFPESEWPEPPPPLWPQQSEAPAEPEPDPHLDAINALWEEFEAQDYAGQIALFLDILDEEGLMDDEMAFEMLNTIYDESVDHDDRDRFDDLVDKLHARLPEVYAHEAHFLLDWRITNALAAGRLDAIPPLARELATTAGEHIDTFNHVLDQLAYHGQLSTLVEMTRIAWPLVKNSTRYFEWVAGEFALQAADYVIFDYLERQASPDPNASELREPLAFYLEIDPEGLARHLKHLTRQTKRHWAMEDFEFKPRTRSRKKIGQTDEARQNLIGLTLEFLNYLRQQEGVPYTKGELGREGIRRYIVDRYDGELTGSKTKLRRPAHLLCPDRGTLDRYLAGMLHFLSPKPYRVAATFELVPAWLRFLESRQLIDAAQREQTLQEMRGLDTELLKVLKGFSADPALQLGMERWRENAERKPPS